jgi:hypothetical protein
MHRQPTTSTDDAVAAIESLDPDAVRGELAELDRRASALRALLHTLDLRDRERRRHKFGRINKGERERV